MFLSWPLQSHGLGDTLEKRPNREDQSWIGFKEIQFENCFFKVGFVSAFFLLVQRNNEGPDMLLGLSHVYTFLVEEL